MCNEEINHALTVLLFSKRFSCEYCKKCQTVQSWDCYSRQTRKKICTVEKVQTVWVVLQSNMSDSAKNKTNAVNKSTLLPRPPSCALDKKTFMDVKSVNSNFKKRDGTIMSKWDMTAKSLADGVGEYEADVWINAQKQRVADM